MKTAEQLNHYQELVKYKDFGYRFNHIDNLHDAVVKMSIIKRDHLDVCDDLKEATEVFMKDLEKAQNSFRKAFELASQVLRGYHEEINPIRFRTFEIMNAERIAFDAEDLDESLRGIAKHDCQALLDGTREAVEVSRKVMGMSIVNNNPFEK